MFEAFCNVQNLVNCVKRANREFAQSFESVQNLVTCGVAKLFAKHSSLFFILPLQKVSLFGSPKSGSKGGFFSFKVRQLIGRKRAALRKIR